MLAQGIQLHGEGRTIHGSVANTSFDHITAGWETAQRSEEGVARWRVFGAKLCCRSGGNPGELRQWSNGDHGGNNKQHHRRGSQDTVAAEHPIRGNTPRQIEEHEHR